MCFRYQRPVLGFIFEGECTSLSEAARDQSEHVLGRLVFA
jgi:hypothetical protein